MKKLAVLAFALLLTGCGGKVIAPESSSQETVVEEHVHEYVKTAVQGTLDNQGYDIYKCDCGAVYMDNFDNHSPRSLVIDFARHYLGDTTPWLETPACTIKDTLEDGTECWEVAYRFETNTFNEVCNVNRYLGGQKNLEHSNTSLDMQTGAWNVSYTYETEHTSLTVSVDLKDYGDGDKFAYFYSYLNTQDTMPFPQGLR